jgi:hypothetical protein
MSVFSTDPIGRRRNWREVCAAAAWAARPARVVVRNACRRRTRQGPRQRGLRRQIKKPAGDPLVARAQMRRRLAPATAGEEGGRQREEDANRSLTGVPGYIVDLRMSLIIAARRSVPAGIALQNRRWPGLIGRATCRGEIVRGFSLVALILPRLGSPAFPREG